MHFKEFLQAYNSDEIVVITLPVNFRESELLKVK